VHVIALQGVNPERDSKVARREVGEGELDVFPDPDLQRGPPLFEHGKCGGEFRREELDDLSGGVVAHDIPAFSSVYSLSLFLISSLNSSISLTTMPSPNSTLPSGVKCRLPLRVSRLKREVEETHPKQVRKLQQASLSPHRFRLALITGIVELIFLSGNNHSPLNTLSLLASIFTS
jgi:hypothetical protein